jgi:hypothetical protein
VYTGFWWGNLRDRDHLEVPGVKWEDNIKMYLQEVGWGAWTGSMSQVRVRWQVLANAVMNLRVP